MTIIDLSPWELSAAAALVVALAGVSLAGGLGIARPLVVAAARMAVQLSLIGLVLKSLFAAQGPWWVALMALAMLGAASFEVTARQKRRFRGGWGIAIGAGAMFASSFTVAIFALAALVRPEPWYEPRYAIPILGMLLGNTMSAIALAIDRLTDAAWRERRTIEARLLLGQPAREAIGGLARDAVRSAMIPVINAMAVAGIVSLPGMMTGQILAGNAPGDAVKYQILIWLLIAAGCGFGMLLAIRLAVRRLFDARDRLRLDHLISPN
ncbi:MAG: iron export ABC transporter permease subunit FetB [Verrucomicrobiales bacterium]